MEFFRQKTPIGFMGQAKRWSLLSLVLILASWVLIWTKGFNYGIDFEGGTLIQVQYPSDAPLGDIRQLLEAQENFKGAQVTFFGSNQEIVIRIKSTSSALGVDIGDEVREILKPTGDFEVRRVDMVGPKIGSELREKGLLAMMFAIIGILIYVTYRFEWRFALASVLALVHDVSITLGVLVLLDIEINLDILAAMLTLLGYSLNDTIIVFDRIREGVHRLKENILNAIIDISITNTLSRTTLTSLTTFFVILSLYIFGGEIIKGFSLTLLVGIVIGTYSSIFIASPLLGWLGFSVSDFRKREANRLQREKEKERLRAMYEKGTL
ncbi:MAG TPA: protein translocase subunit SecF [Epsilonproteobacteria bacterium]|nr:protein translocase subunit SecF [Campylobacterota bacterium]